MNKQDLLTGDILPTMTKLALPVMATSFLQMAYNLVDMIWIGRVGSGAVAAVGAAGMYTWLSSGIVMFAKIGGQIKVGHSLGAGEEKEAIAYAQHAIQMALLLGILVGSVCVIFAKGLIGFFQLHNPEVEYAAIQYLQICGVGIIFWFICMLITGLMIAMGNSQMPFRIMFVGLFLNMVLDPILILGWGISTPMGARGAALATCIAQGATAILFLVEAKKDTHVFAKIRIFRKLELKRVKEIILLSAPSAFQSMIFTSISMILARFVASWGDVAIAVQKVGSQIESITWMTADGFANALTAFTAQNYGAGNIVRVKKGYKRAMALMGIWGIFTSFLLLLFPKWIFQIFISEAQILPMGISYLRIIGYSQLFMCLEITTAGAFAGLGRTLPASIEGIALTALRIPLAATLSATVLSLNGIWWSISITSIAKGILIIVWFLFTLRGLNRGGVAR